MIKKIKKSLILGGLMFCSLGLVSPSFASSNASVSPVSTVRTTAKCKGIKLNTDLPFLGRCIGTTEKGNNQLTAFPRMIQGIMKVIVSAVLVLSFLMIVSAGVLIATSGYEKSNYAKGMSMISTVAKALAMLGVSGVILKLINPNFFT